MCWKSYKAGTPDLSENHKRLQILHGTFTRTISFDFDPNPLKFPGIISIFTGENPQKSLKVGTYLYSWSEPESSLKAGFSGNTLQALFSEGLLSTRHICRKSCLKSLCKLRECEAGAFFYR